MEALLKVTSLTSNEKGSGSAEASTSKGSLSAKSPVKPALASWPATRMRYLVAGVSSRARVNSPVPVCRSDASASSPLMKVRRASSESPSKVDASKRLQ